MIASILIAVVALLHLYFMYLEMVAWDTPPGRKAFKLNPEFAAASKMLAANQGLYNGFLAAGLIWGLYLGGAGFEVKTFFLVCVVVAGLFGAATVARKILYVQALPAAAALVALWLGLVRQATPGQRSVSFSSMRRFLLRASSLSAGSSGWNSPKPAATSRLAGTPFSIRNFTTEVARAEESSQLSR